MNFVLKLLIKNIFEKKFRTFLIIFSAAAACALIFAAIASSSTITNVYIQQMKKYTGSADIIVYPGSDSTSPYIKTKEAQQIQDKLDYVIGCFESEGSYESDTGNKEKLALFGCEFEDLQRLNPVYFIDNKELTNFYGREIIIGKDFAERADLHKGEYIYLNINGNKHKYKIVGIAQPQGLFAEDGFTVYAVMPKDTLSQLYGQKGVNQMLYIKTNEEFSKSAVIESLTELYNRYEVDETISEEEAMEMASMLSAIFMVMAVMVCLMSIFIIFTSFKVITMERFPVVGTLRSIGATRLTTKFFLLGESFLYAIFGTIFGCVLGYGVLYLIAQLSKSPWMPPTSISVEFEPTTLLIAIILTIVVCILSSLIPINKLSKTPVKEIILNEIKWGKEKKGWVRTIIGIVMVTGVVCIPPICPKEYLGLASGLLIIFSLLGVILLVPFITKVLGKILERLFIRLFGNIGFLAAKNLNNNKSEMNNISLLAVGMTVILIVSMLSGNIVAEVLDFYSDCKFDIFVVGGNEMDRDFSSQLSRSRLIGDVHGVYQTSSVEVVNKNEKIALLAGIDANKFLDFWDFRFELSREEINEALNKERVILLSNVLKEKLSVQKNDVITLKLSDREKSYRVGGFFNCLRNMGNYALVSEKFFKLDTGKNSYSEMYIKVSNGVEGDKVVDFIKNDYQRMDIFIETVKDIQAMDEESFTNIFNMLKIFSLFAMLIGIIGIVNNLLVSFIQRRRYIAVQKSVGMSRKQTASMVLLEAISSGLIGGAVGGLASALSTYLLPYFMTSIDMYMDIPFRYDMAAIAVGCGIIVMLVASVSPALKSSKLNIIEAIKFE